MNFNLIIQLVAAIIYISFLPGFLISFIFFKPDKIGWIERSTFSLTLSVAIVPLVAFYANLAGIQFSINNIIIEVLVICTLSGAIIPFQYISSNKSVYKVMYKKKQNDDKILTKTTSKKLILNTHIVLRELFQISLVTYLILLLAETIQKEFVSFFFNLNILLGIVMSSGVLMILTNHEEKKILPVPKTGWNWKTIMNYIHEKQEREKQENRPKELSKWDWYYITILSIGGGILVYYKTEELQALSVIISLATMTIIGLLSYLIFSESE